MKGPVEVTRRESSRASRRPRPSPAGRSSCPSPGCAISDASRRRSAALLGTPGWRAFAPPRDTSWDGHDHLHPDGVGRGRVGEVGRKGLSLLLVNLEDGRQRITHIIECVRDRVPLGEQFGQQRRGHGVSALGLGLKDERQLVIHQCLQFQATRRCPFVASRLTPASLGRPPRPNGFFSCRDPTTEPIIGRLGSPARGRAEKSAAASQSNCLPKSSRTTCLACSLIAQGRFVLCQCDRIRGNDLKVSRIASALDDGQLLGEIGDPGSASEPFQMVRLVNTEIPWVASPGTPYLTRNGRMKYDMCGYQIMLTVPEAKPIRKLGSLSLDQLTLVEQVVRGWLGL